jgi:large subunit ribosomal protein L10
MNSIRTEKQAFIDSVDAQLKDAHLIVVLHQLGLNADETLQLRRAMRAAGVALRVGKNTLTRRALADSHIEGLAAYLKGPTMIAMSKDPVAAAKAAAEFAKKNKKLEIVVAAMGGQILDAKATMALATLPSLDELRGKIVGLLQAPATKIAGVLQAPAGQLARVMSARSKQAA